VSDVVTAARARRLARLRGDAVNETMSAFRAERRKLQAQLSTKLLVLVCVVGPFAFAAVLSSQTASPADTLFGVWVHSSGFAISLVVLGFAGSWGFPLIAGIVAGDIFSSEDRYGTWKMVLTRSRTREQVFAGKVLAGLTLSLALLALLAIASLVAGLVFVGGQGQVGLSGTVFSSGHTAVLVLLSWLLSVPPMAAFTALAMLLSVATRNGIVGVIGPSVAGLVMQLLLLIGSGVWAHALLVSSAFNDWHPLFVDQRFYGLLIAGCVVGLLWTVVCLWTAWAILRNRDFAGPPVSRGRGWLMPARITIALAAAIAVFAVAGNWGPAGVTATRVKASFTPAFTRLTVLQQRQLGRNVPPGAKLNIQTTCVRRAATPNGPGDWACTLVVYVPQLGAVPFQQTPVTYDMSINSDGCYKATSPPQFVGAQTMRDSRGHTIVNPLFTIYGCFDTL
jgi:ABC-2 type transport system permease protein